MPSPRGLFLGLTQVELDALRVSALARITSGERTAMSGGAKSGSKNWQMSPQDVLDEVIFAEQASGARATRVSKVYQTLSRDYPHPATIP